MWKNIVERGRPQMAIWRTCIACWVPKATDTHSQYVKLTAFPLQNWLHERASVLRYTYMACLALYTYPFYKDSFKYLLLISCATVFRSALHT